MTGKSYVALGRSLSLRVHPCLFHQLGKPVQPSFPTYPRDTEHGCIGPQCWLSLVCAASESHFPPLNSLLCIYNTKCRCHNHSELPAQAATASLLVILIL